MTLSQRTKLSPFTIAELLKHVTATTTFVFQGTLYQQVDGLPMGGRLSAFISSIWLQKYDQQIVSNLPRGSQYWRYVDDILIYTSPNNDLLQSANSLSPSLAFEESVPPGLQLHYLDVHFLLSYTTAGGHSIQTTVYHKPTETYQHLHWQSASSYSSKLSALRYHIRRAYTHCSSYESRMTELRLVITQFYQRDYPPRVLWSMLQSALTPRPPRTTMRRVVFPFVPFPMQQQIRGLLKKYNCQPIFLSGRTLYTYFQHYKDVWPKELQRNVIYQLTCSLCYQPYIGQTGRGLLARLNEHKRQHHFNTSDCAHTPNIESVRILAHESTLARRLVSESILIATTPGCYAQPSTNVSALLVETLQECMQHHTYNHPTHCSRTSKPTNTYDMQMASLCNQSQEDKAHVMLPDPTCTQPCHINGCTDEIFLGCPLCNQIYCYNHGILSCHNKHIT